MIYVALLRAVNVGGNNKIEMPKLKVVFEGLGLTHVKTYINSGNVIFRASAANQAGKTRVIEAAIEKVFGFQISVQLRNFEAIKQLIQAIPSKWVNDLDTKCDVMFLMPELDMPSVVELLPANPEVEDVQYFPGAVVWRIDREKLYQSRMSRLSGTALHKKITVRNLNTVRKIYELMQQ